MLYKGHIFLGEPVVLPTGTEAEIEALPDILQGAMAYATDLPASPFGTYNGVSWDWQPLAGGGTGDVVGPASAVDSNFAAFDTTTGKLLKDSGIASDDIVIKTFLTQGPQELLNPYFTLNADNWTLGAGWAWVDGVGIQHTAGNIEALHQSGTLISNFYYLIAINVTGTTGQVQVFFDDGDSFIVTAGTGIVDFTGKYYANVPDKVSIIPTSDFDGAIVYVEMYRAAFLQTANIEDAINDGELNKAPSENAVFDALAGKAATSQKLDAFGTPDNNTNLNANTENHGLAPKATAPAAGLLNVLSIINGATAYSLNDFATWVRSSLLTGLSTATNAVIAATDTVLVALGKLQAQITAIVKWLPFAAYIHIAPLTASPSYVFIATVDRTITFVSLAIATLVGSNNSGSSGSHYWTVTLEKVDGTDITTVNTSANTADTWAQKTTATFSPTTAGVADIAIRVIAVKTGTPGDLYLGFPDLVVTY